MVAHSGATVRADRLRPLSLPRPIRVEVDDRGLPRDIGGVPVLEVIDRWRIDDEWWRQEISRMYFHVALGASFDRLRMSGSFGVSPASYGGLRAGHERRPPAPLLLTIFHDLIRGGWYVQEAATPLDELEAVHVLTPPTSEAHAERAETEDTRSSTPMRRVG